MQAKPVHDWPDPVEVLNEGGRSDVVLLCEHASNHMPAEYRHLGLDLHHLERHIAWDIGVAEVTRRLSKRLDAPAFLGTYSRLLIDLNRPLHSSSSIPIRSEDTEVPGNLDIDATEKARRAAAMFTPFHDRVTAHLDHRARERRPTRIVTVHSFTPVFLGKPRPWHAGVLHAGAGAFARSILAGLRADGTLNAEANVPYVVSRDADYALPVHGDDRDIPAVLIEIRQDLLADAAGYEDWTDRLATAIPALETEPVR